MKNQTKTAFIGFGFLIGAILLAGIAFADFTLEGAPAAGGEAPPSLTASREPQAASPLSSIDSDLDGLSDYDEINIYGTDPMRESTDGDYYDDGEEILGYSDPSKGNLGGQMPSYVKWPGSSAFVAAYPQVDFTVDPNYRLEINQDITFATRNSAKFDRTFGTIVTTTVSSSYGVGGSHTAGSHQDSQNAEFDQQFSSTLKNTLNQKNTSTSETNVHSTDRTKGWEIGTELGYHNGIKATVSPSYGDMTTTTDKNTKLNTVGTNIAKQQSDYSMSGTILQKTQSSGNVSSSTITATSGQTVSTSVSNVNLYTVGTAQEWENATTQNTIDAARLYFTFQLKNTGTGRTVGITDLRFTIKIGNFTKTYPSLNTAGSSLPALNPGESHAYAVDGIQLSLAELKAFDSGEKVQIYIEDYNLGNSQEEAYALDAYEGGVLFIVDDAGKDDGTNLKYYLSYAAPGENYFSVLQRLNKTIPSGSANNLKKVLDISANEAAIFSLAGLSVEENSAWFAQSEGISSLPFLQKEAKRGSKVILTYSKDSDFDNYPDRAERIAGTNPNDLNSHPNPNVITGYYIENAAIVVDNVTLEKTKPVFTLKPKVANTGNYDAYGAEIRMLAPNSEIEIVDGFSGGAVRIKPNESFVVNDSLVWKPKVSGVQGTASFITNNPTIVAGAIALIDGDGSTYAPGGGTVTLPEGELLYKSRVFASSGHMVGYQIVYSIDISPDGKTWTTIVQTGYTANWDEHIFQFPVYAKYIRISGTGYYNDGVAGRTGASFDIGEFELYRYEYGGKPLSEVAKPVIETLYNDPQGPHRFVSDLQIENANKSISDFSAEMRRGMELKIETAEKLEYGETANVKIDFTNPHIAIEGGKLFVSYNSNGTLKLFSQPLNFLSGNTYANFNFDTNEFGTGIKGKEIAVLAVALDSQGNAIAENIETIAVKGDPIIIQPPQNNTTDTTPPASITNLGESTKTESSITWQWTNPADADFNHVEVWINEIFRANVTTNNYIATGLTSNTSYEIEARPLDNSGNKGNWTNDSAKTGNTPLPCTANCGGTTGGNSGGGGGGSDSPKCNVGYELKSGKCTAKIVEQLVRLDSNEPKVAAPKISDEKPRVSYAEVPSEVKSDSKITAYLAAVGTRRTIFGAVIAVVLLAAYYLFARKYTLSLEYANEQNI